MTNNSKFLESPSGIRVIGIGNPLMGDDGAGLAVLEELRTAGLPAGVELVDGGTGGLTLLTLLEGAKMAIILDAIDGGRPPGTILQPAAADLTADASPSAWMAHAPGLAEVLTLGRELGSLPAVHILGIQPAAVEPGVGLSREVAAAVPAAVGRVRQLLAVPCGTPAD